MGEEENNDRVGLYGSKKALAQGQWDEIVQGLGLVSIEFQSLESVIKMAIWELVANAEIVIGALITAELSFKAASHLLYALAIYRWQNDSATLQKLNDILNRCEQAEGDRNRLIHSDWYPDIKTGKGAMRIKSTARNRKGLRIQREPTTPAEMNKVAEELKTCRHQLWDLLIDKLPKLKTEFTRLMANPRAS
jgi:hypothetical protein